MWSLGITIYTALSGFEFYSTKAPQNSKFLGFHDMYTLYKSVMEDGREVELQVAFMKEEVSPFARALIMDALQFDPIKRPTMGRMLEQVRNYLKDQDYDYVPEPCPVTISPEDPAQLKATESLLALMDDDKELESSDLSDCNRSVLTLINLAAMRLLLDMFPKD